MLGYGPSTSSVPTPNGVKLRRVVYTLHQSEVSCVEQEHLSMVSLHVFLGCAGSTATCHSSYGDARIYLLQR